VAASDECFSLPSSGLQSVARRRTRNLECCDRAATRTRECKFGLEFRSCWREALPAVAVREHCGVATMRTSVCPASRMADFIDVFSESGLRNLPERSLDGLRKKRIERAYRREHQGARFMSRRAPTLV
jgi:hypothetical protein